MCGMLGCVALLELACGDGGGVATPAETSSTGTMQADSTSSGAGTGSSTSAVSGTADSDTTTAADTSTGTTAASSEGDDSTTDASSGGPAADVLALRIVALGVRDPHLFADGCPPGADDATASLNDSIDGSFAIDGPPADGIFDDSIVLLFGPADAASGALSIQNAACSVVGAACTAGPAIAEVGFTHHDDGACLAPAAAELGYGPIAAIDGPCYVGDASSLVLPLYPAIALTITLDDAVVAVADTGDGEHYEGLIRGFLPADAAAAIPVLSVGTLADAMCAADLDEGGSGWWFHYAFAAERIALE